MRDIHILTEELFRYAGLACVLLLAVAAVVLCLLCADAAAKARAKPPTADLAAVRVELSMGFVAAADEFFFGEVSTLQLCDALRRSYLPSPDGLSEQAEWERIWLRGHLLDEIERRDPEGFKRWLDTLPRAGSDPSRYLSVGR